MSVTKVINIEVRDAELQQLEKELDKVGASFSNVEQETQKTSKGLKDVADNGGAIATLDSLTGGLASRVRDAAEATKLFSFNLKGVRAALIATGIGAFVVALGVVVAYWDEISDFVTGVNKKLEIQNELLNQNISNSEFELSLLEAKEKLLIAEGKSTEEIVQQKRKVILLQQEQNMLLLENLRTQLEREKQQVQEVTRWEKIQIAALEAVGLYDRAALARAEAFVGDEDERSAIADLEERLQAATLRSEALKLSLLNLDKPVDIATGRATGSNTQIQERETVEAIDPLKSTEVIQAQAIADATLEINKNKAAQELILEQAVADAKVGIAQNTLALVGALAEEGSAVGKGVALAQTVIAGIEGVQNAYKTAQASPITIGFPAYPLIQAGLAGAFSALQIKKILSTDPTGRTTPNLGTGGASGGAAAPSFNVVGQSGVNQLAQSLGQDQQPIQAFVVGSQVTTQQQLDNNIVETATLG